jgi:hypothetical protein
MKCVVDTNVPVVANGRERRRPHSLECRLAAVELLNELVTQGRVVIDFAGEVRAEYRGRLNPKGEPGVGDRFYFEVLTSSPRFVETIDLHRRADGEFTDCPQSLIDAGFDVSDRKFVALAKLSSGVVINAVDSDWIEHADLLSDENISVRNICGCVQDAWFSR